jgi:hypothetical protein
MINPSSAARICVCEEASLHIKVKQMHGVCGSIWARILLPGKRDIGPRYFEEARGRLTKL